MTKAGHQKDSWNLPGGHSAELNMMSQTRVGKTGKESDRVLVERTVYI